MILNSIKDEKYLMEQLHSCSVKLKELADREPLKIKQTIKDIENKINELNKEC